MAAPTPVTYTRQVGHGGVSLWKATWTDSTNITDSVIVDLSALASGYVNSLKICKITCVNTANIDLLLEFDATADQLVAFKPGGTNAMTYDFTQTPDGGLVKTASGATGDLVLTTTNAANGEEVFLVIEWWAD